jgi:transcriptional regulator with XRE-family HTH domain
MKQDLEGQKLFHQIVDETPVELKTQLRFSDAIAEKLDRMLKKRGMTQRDLARKTGKTEAEVSRWLGGTHNFTLKTLALISVALGEDVITVLNQFDLASESCHMAAEEQAKYGKKQD